MATSHFVSSSPTPAHQLHHPFRHFEPHPSPLSSASIYRRNQSHANQVEDHEGRDFNASLAGSEDFIDEAEDQEEEGDQTHETDMLEDNDDDQGDMMDEQDPHASEAEYDEDNNTEYDEGDDEEQEEEEEELAEQDPFSPTLDASFATSMSIGTAPPTPSPNPPQGTSTTLQNAPPSAAANSIFLPAHLFAPNPNAMPPSSSPHRMDISPAPARRCSISTRSRQPSGFQSPDDPFGGAPSGSQPPNLWKANPTSSEARRTIGLRKTQARLKLPAESVFLRSAQTAAQKSTPCPVARPSSDGMDIDSPSYAQPGRVDGMGAHSSQMGSDDQPTGTARFCQRTSRSGSQSSSGKRSRSDEDDGGEQRPSRRNSSSHARQKALEARQSSSPQTFLIGPSRPNRLFGHPAHSPFQPSSSPSETISPSVKAAAKMTLGRKAGERSLSGFRFPISKVHLPSAANPSTSRSQQYGKGSLGSASGSALPFRRPALDVVQSSATLFSRHQSSASGTSTGGNRQRDAIGRPASKSRRAISFAATPGENISLLLQGDSLVADPDEEDEESELDASSIFNCSPAPRSAHGACFPANGTWPKQNESPIRPNRSASYNESQLNLTRKTSAPLQSGSASSLAPPPFNAGASCLQSPTRPLVATMAASVESPVGMAFSEKERAGKILPCHKVSNDGLMRISPETMDRLLEGVYDDSISQKVVIDCRFGYEYEGGHIRAAINIQDKKSVDKMLLQGELFARGQSDVPLPSESGKVDSSGEKRKVVVVFHCEYSAMRAPTVAKYLREQDRHKNMPHYPALHYPEVYILEGGYAKYFAHSPQHCDGQYVRMDDPGHRSNRHADLNQFRTRESAVFSRAKSFTYGESKKLGKASAGLQQKKPGFMSGHSRPDSHKQRDLFGHKPAGEGSSQYPRIVEEDEEELSCHP
ncbi:hypothetical protein PCANC_03903 [Puccinia coronata f. sp. avenae]|uniref:M-phase inducer phosphatase n=1 Tax=Puccinia coronata f. sp. avenae TaxID=200324 RepID=A0A2N5W1K6_9BASI|nr:hypothetical protein PCASD_02671 [Puccinia coronata f. sp. avenae]PLW56072.1 hypothetical protein PCANC_03903 [Puccinia coronata f. sp. avenae]